jgi:hypothetical protein
MAYAKIDDDNRIVYWSNEPLEGLVEFSNGDYVNKNCIDGLDDFVIEDGEAVFSPLPEKEIERLKRKLSDTDYVAAKIAEGAATREDYAGLIEQRQKWRDRINALRGGE